MDIIPKIETSHAILRLSDKYVLQLRDDRPDIAARGQWSLFGGQINGKETPLEAIERELFEELSIRPRRFRFLWSVDYHYDFAKGIVRTWLFSANVDDVWPSYRLKEGQAVKSFSFDELEGLDIPDVIKQCLRKYHTEEVRKGDDGDKLT